MRLTRVLIVLTAATLTWTAGIMVADAAPAPSAPSVQEAPNLSSAERPR